MGLPGPGERPGGAGTRPPSRLAGRFVRGRVTGAVGSFDSSFSVGLRTSGRWSVDSRDTGAERGAVITRRGEAAGALL